MTDKNKPLDDLTEDQLKEGMQAAGKHLAYLIYVAPLSEESKEKIIKAMPFLSLEQLDQLAKTLEEGIKQSTGDIDKDNMLAKIDSALAQYEDKQENVDKVAHAQLDEIEKELQQLEV